MVWFNAPNLLRLTKGRKAAARWLSAVGRNVVGETMGWGNAGEEVGPRKSRKAAARWLSVVVQEPSGALARSYWMRR